MVARVLAASGKRQASVEVLRVLRGTYKPGQRVTMEVYNAQERIGQVRILSDPEAFMAPTFGNLSVDFENEVRWILEPKKPTDVAEALRRVQGYSNASRRCGVEWLKETETFPVTQILEALAKRRAEGEESTYEAGCLIDVLTLRLTPEAEAFLLREVKTWIAGPSQKIDWREFSLWPTSRGERLTELVGSCGSSWSPMFFTSGRERPEAYRSVCEKMEALLLSSYAKLDQASQSDVTYALVSTEAMTAAKLLALLPKGGGRDGFALGLGRTAKAYARVFAREEAEGALAAAIKEAKQPDLLAALRKELK